MAKLVEHDGRHRGELHLRQGEGGVVSTRGSPSDDLAPWVAYYWRVRWDLRGRESYEQHVLTEPRQHLVFERDRETGAAEARQVGLCRGRFTRVISGWRDVLGVAFHPGAFVAWLGRPASSLTDRMEVVDLDAAAVMAGEDDAARVARVEALLRAAVLKLDLQATLAQRLVEEVEAHPELTRVEQLAARAGLSTRSLQRLFTTYVGAGPKWVIRRYRLIEAARAIEKGEAPDLTELSITLGYFDQPHFVRDFKAVVGHPPSAHR